MNRYRVTFAVVVCVWIGVTMNHYGAEPLRIVSVMAVWSLACMTEILPAHRRKFWTAAVVVVALSLAGCASFERAMCRGSMCPPAPSVDHEMRPNT